MIDLDERTPIKLIMAHDEYTDEAKARSDAEREIADAERRARKSGGYDQRRLL